MIVHSAESPSLHELLKKHFGFDHFLPLQERIIGSALQGRDVLALLPTGGGKSLCFQLPSLAQQGLTVVVSPLIALMKDQVDALEANGIPATFLNSTVKGAESRARLAALDRGAFRLLYIAPERLVLDGVVEDLKRWNVNRIAVDEAHCISEWGHDFRPEYRQLAGLRGALPDVPVMALTATATERVRLDIIKQLHLRKPEVCIGSFDRPNLHYRVEPKEDGFEQVLNFVRAHPRQSGIVYCQARRTTESVADQLREHGISARPYHAGLPDQERQTNQELFLKDEVRVICATIAFGMGINKPNVRFVLHHDLPKNIEGYYQETGRAGRDGLPSECVLFFGRGDIVKINHFIEQKTDAHEAEVARRQLQQMVAFAESSTCRRFQLMHYFGEAYSKHNCDGCDNCCAPRESFDATIAAQKLLSCVYRAWRHSGFNCGLNHIVDVLTGNATANVVKRGHDTLSTFGIGREHSVEEWKAIGQQLIQMGLLSHETSDKYVTVKLAEAGMSLLKERRPVQLFRPAKAAPAAAPRRAGELPCDEALFDKLSELRALLASQKSIAAHNIFSDVTLRQMARSYPTSHDALARVEGVVWKKQEEFGDHFIDVIGKHLRHNPRLTFPSLEKRTRKKRNRAPGAERRRDSIPEGDYDENLFEKLRVVRKRLAEEQKVPPYIILHDSMLREIARSFPTSTEELSEIRGIGPSRAARLQAVLEEVKLHKGG